VFILFLAAIFLGEVLGFVQYLGVFLIVVGAMLISSRNFKFDFGKAFWFVIIGCLIFSVCSVLVKYLLDFADFWTVFSYVRIGMIFLLIPMACLSVGELKSAVKKHGAKVLGVMSLSEILTVAAVLIGTIAVSIGSVTLVNALSSIEPFFVLFIALILSVHHPKILKEELGKAVVLVKLAAVILIFAGAILIM
jgi:drug/metabolite transporter (DMT)-like permease